MIKRNFFLMSIAVLSSVPATAHDFYFSNASAKLVGQTLAGEISITKEDLLSDLDDGGKAGLDKSVPAYLAKRFYIVLDGKIIVVPEIISTKEAYPSLKISFRFTLPKGTQRIEIVDAILIRKFQSQQNLLAIETPCRKSTLVFNSSLMRKALDISCGK